ncbi:flagellar assembly protein FliW [Halarsenatibacter silvermanii]|uniref:Flagellar assembly factor FliW n=1 Tax=Halarsenatibacter silvermanii TaxID=321763 RepID=A0A1G9M0K5_9FIRM|nr:flagellar assembly protein FliW [Halarsenatibacter silvermanii]SDL67736.1 flagellar assembly factor FliW [Halarsenatibacter silvermanii]
MATREVETQEFGTIKIEEDEIITFPRGLPGFDDAHEFILKPLKKESPFLILQSLDYSELAFVTLEPVSFTDSYEFEINQATQELLEIEKEEEVGVVVIINLEGENNRIYANLSAPVVINVEKNLARQVILDQDHYPLRHPIELKPIKEGSA